MKLNTEPKPVLAICLNPAWQKTLLFKKVNHGQVNRAYLVKQCGGGKGVNVVRVFRMLGLPIALAGFAGGDTGEKLKGEIIGSGAFSLIVDTASVTRCCTTVISEENGEVTELIEPSGSVSDAEQEALLRLIKERISEFGAVVCSGTVPPGVPPTFYASVAEAAIQQGIPFVLDAVNNIEPTLNAGMGVATAPSLSGVATAPSLSNAQFGAGAIVLKINASELRQIAGLASLPEAANALLSRHPRLGALAVTDGAAPAWLFARGSSYKITLPPLPHVVSAIGGGDCTAAILTRRLAEGLKESELADAFAEVLSCASASCLTDTPSLFDPAVAEEIRKQIEVVSG
jgi:fructose-1-phosphate kinase PfkB-like protein